MRLCRLAVGRIMQTAIQDKRMTYTNCFTYRVEPSNACSKPVDFNY
jgi:hypothetical protein